MKLSTLQLLAVTTAVLAQDAGIQAEPRPAPLREPYVRVPPPSSQTKAKRKREQATDALQRHADGKKSLGAKRLRRLRRRLGRTA